MTAIRIVRECFCCDRCGTTSPDLIPGKSLPPASWVTLKRTGVDEDMHMCDRCFVGLLEWKPAAERQS